MKASLSIAALVSVLVCVSDAGAQSFNCRYAKKADEVLICQTAQLSRLDEAMATLLSKVRTAASALRRMELDKDQRLWLRRRTSCGRDHECLEAAYRQRISELNELEKRGAGNRRPKVLLGSHIGSATILSLSGTDSDKAILLARRELDDAVEACVREIGADENGSVDSSAVAECAKDDLRQTRGEVIQRRAFCGRRTVYTEFGNYSMVNFEKEEESVFDGKPYRPIRTDWKDHRTEQIIGNCSACNTPQILDTFKILCPNLYQQLFGGYDPH